MIKNHNMAKGLDHKLTLIPNEANMYSLHTINITKTPVIFDTPLIGQIYIDNWIDKKICLTRINVGYFIP